MLNGTHSLDYQIAGINLSWLRCYFSIISKDVFHNISILARKPTSGIERVTNLRIMFKSKKQKFVFINLFQISNFKETLQEYSVEKSYPQNLLAVGRPVTKTACINF